MRRLLSQVLCLGIAGPALQGQDLEYPDSRTVDHVDLYHGEKVPDPYRWLEDPDTVESRAWIEAQNEFTQQYLSRIEERPRIAARLTELWNYEKRGVTQRVGHWLVESRNDGLQNQSVITKTPVSGGDPQVLLDPNKLSEDGTVALSGLAFSHGGARLAYGVSSGGSDWREWRVRDVESGADLEDRIPWSKFSGVAWAPDDSGFYYCRYPTPKEGDELEAANYNQRLYFHRLGDAWSDDALIYERPDHKEWGFQPTVTDDGRFLILSVWRGTDRRNLVITKDLRDEASKFVELVDEFVADFSLLGSRGDEFVFLTDHESPMRRVVSIDVRHPDQGWTEIVAESGDRLEDATILDHQLVLTYLVDASSRVRIHNLEGELIGALDLPGIGTVRGFTGKAADTETWFSFSSFTSPSTLYHYDFSSQQTKVWFQPRVDFDPSTYETQLMFARSKDGTAVPFFVTARKGLERTGDHPTLLYGYGGFNISLSPSFSVSNLVWLEMGGVYVMAILRGGSEYGETWHQAGMLDRKQNVFNDFISVGEYLVDQGYTRPSRLAISGGSNGGLLVGACVNQRPDLFAAALPAVGVMDMLRFHQFTIGWAWVSEYGSSEDPEQYATLKAYSPLHNIKDDTAYPSVMVTTGDHDDRVVPAHSFKYAARLQSAQAGPRPVLIRVETRAGHGAGKPTKMRIQEAADKLSFLRKELGAKVDG